MDRELREILGRPAPGEDEARERSLDVTRSAFERRIPAPRQRSALRPTLVIVLGAVVVSIAVTPVGSAIGSWVKDAGERLIGGQESRRVLTELPAPGRLLVNTARGAWVVNEDGSRRRLGNYAAASWSPGGLYVVATQAEGRDLVAITPAGKPRWALGQSQSVRSPRWAPSGLRIAYFAGHTLRVVDGDGSDDTQLAESSSLTPAAWRPAEDKNILAHVDQRGRIAVLDAATGEELWSSTPKGRTIQLAWSADGERLAAVADESLTIYDGTGKRLRRIALPTEFAQSQPGLVNEIAFAPRGHRLALVREAPRDGYSEAVMLNPDGPRLDRRRVYLGRRGIGGLAWSPDGDWLLISSDGTGSWVFQRPDQPGQPIVTPNVSELFKPPVPPSIGGWCCSDR